MVGEEELLIPGDVLLKAYTKGWFPMCHEDGLIYWHDPDPRAVFPLDRIAPNARMRTVMRSAHFTTTIDQSFTDVVNACADRTETWIDARIIRSYTALHRAGHAHSIETWQDDQLVGGIYGVALGGAFFGESMFSRANNASKVAFYTLVEVLKQKGYALFDSQYINAFTRQLGAVEVERVTFQRTLEQALALPVRF